MGLRNPYGPWQRCHSRLEPERRPNQVEIKQAIDWLIVMMDVRLGRYPPFKERVRKDVDDDILSTPSRSTKSTSWKSGGT